MEKRLDCKLMAGLSLALLVGCGDAGSIANDLGVTTAGTADADTTASDAGVADADGQVAPTYDAGPYVPPTPLDPSITGGNGSSSSGGSTGVTGGSTGTTTSSTGGANTSTGNTTGTTGTTATTTGGGITSLFGGLLGGLFGGGTTGGTTGTTTGGTTGSTGTTTPAPTVPLNGDCCDDGECLCRGDAPSSLTSNDGPYRTDSYSLSGTGCIYYPTDAEPPFAAVAISDGYLGSGGCGRTQTSSWGDFLASWGIAAMIIETGSQDQPGTRGDKLIEGIEGFKSENENSSSPLYQKMAGRYGTSGFSMGGGGTTYASYEDSSLLSSVALMPWGPTRNATRISVPTLITCGSSDGTAPCRSHGTPAYGDIPSSTPKMRIEVSAGHSGSTTAGGGLQGAYGLAWHKAFLEGDERWLTLLAGADSEEDNL